MDKKLVMHLKLKDSDIFLPFHSIVYVEHYEEKTIVKCVDGSAMEFEDPNKKILAPLTAWLMGTEE